jgi:hypothetical protein
MNMRKKVLVMPEQSKGTTPQPDGPAPIIGCTPCRRVLLAFRAQVIAAVRRGRDYRSIAAQYGVRAEDVWQIVAEELADRRAA